MVILVGLLREICLETLSIFLLQLFYKPNYENKINVQI